MTESENSNLKEIIFHDDEINLTELFLILWKEKVAIILITSLFAIGSVFFALQLTNYYISDSLLVERNDTGTQSLLSQYSGVASLVGVSLPSSGGSNVMQVIELIKSREFLRHLLTFEDILPSIMAVEGYDNESKKLLFNPKIYNSETKTWTRKLTRNRKQEPSYIETHKVFINDLLTIVKDNKTGFIKIQIEHVSPNFAKEFLELIIKEANSLKRSKDIEASSQSLKYLQTELLKTPLIGIKESINTLIEAQLETQMVAQLHDDYSLVMIDPPFVPENKSRPSRSIVCIVITLIGGLLSVSLVLIRHYFFSEKGIIRS